MGRPGGRVVRAAGVGGLVLACTAAFAAPVRAQAPEPPPLTGATPPSEVAHTTLVHPPYSHTMGIHRARPIHLRLFLADRTRFDDPQGMVAVKFAADDDPEERADDFRLTVFGVNSGRGEIVFNSTMQTLGIYGGRGSGDGRFDAPRGITATADGRVYVADTGNRRVARLRWDPERRALTWLGAWTGVEPLDVAADARGQVYASDPAGIVWRFADPSVGGAEPPVRGDRWPLPDDVADPRGLAVGDSLERWYRPRHYRLYLIDRGGARLRAYGADGRVEAETSPAAVHGPAGPAGSFSYLALDYYGNVYATDPRAGAVVKFDPDLQPLAVFAGPGDPEPPLAEPRGIAIWKRFGQVFVAERDGARYFFVGADFEVDPPVVVRVAEAPEGYELDVFLTEAAEVNVAFLDAAGDTLAVAGAGTHPAGARAVGWGAAGWREPPAAGWRERAVSVTIEARPTYSSRRRFSRVRTVGLVWSGP